MSSRSLPFRQLIPLAKLLTIFIIKLTVGTTRGFVSISPSPPTLAGPIPSLNIDDFGFYAVRGGQNLFLTLSTLKYACTITGELNLISLRSSAFHRPVSFFRDYLS